MDSKYQISNIRTALASRLRPSVTLWNRLEGRPRTANFDRALKAEVRDALWMLTRQWQIGEFQGDDAGSPVFTKIHMQTSHLTHYRADGDVSEPFEDNVPLEAKVERRSLPFVLDQKEISLDLRLQMGRQWIKLLKQQSDGLSDDYSSAYLTAYAIELPNNTEKNAYLYAHPETWQSFAAVAGRRMDGAKLYFYLKADATHRAYDGLGVAEADKPLIDQRAERFVQWFESLYYQPSGEDAWNPTRLEYAFSCAAPQPTGEMILSADEYYQGHLDWYNFDIDRATSSLTDETIAMPPPITQTLIPAPITFAGMPNTRWWTFEDRKTNFGDIKPDTTDLAKLLLMEFGLVYANDWFLVPFTLPVGAIAQIKGMSVTNVFGERLWIEAAGRGADDAWQRWSMFTLNTKGKSNEPADTSLLLLPTVPKIQESRPLEAVTLIRDEVANLVWGIETRIPLANGYSKSGSEAAIETRNFYQEPFAAAPRIDYKAPIAYQVMNTIPEHWIPFIPVHIDGDNRQIQLQRAALPRILEGDSRKPKKVRPRTVLLRQGLDQPTREAYYLHEEEVPRSGIQVTQSFQRTRWRDGSVFVWLGVRKQVGRGEGSSGLAFDRIVEVRS